jgi:heptosyltransferase-3
MNYTRGPLSHEEFRRADRIAVCCRWGIGDLVTTLPSLRVLRETAPKAKITAIGARPATQLLDAGDLVDDIVNVQDLGIAHFGDASDASREQASQWVWNGPKFDIVLDALHAAPALRDALWHFGYKTAEGDQQVQNHRTARGLGLARGVNAGTVAGWGVDLAETEQPAVATRPEDEQWAEDFLETTCDGKTPAAVVPVASLSLKRWPAERFASVADALAADGPVLLLVGPQKDVADAVLRKMCQSAFVVAAEPLLRQAALLRRCRVCVSNDTGLLHVADAVGTPVVGIFGPTSGRVILTPGPTRQALGRPIDCPHRRDDQLSMPPCWQTGTCLHDEPRSCVDRVSPEVVASAARRVVRLRVA